MGMCYLELGNVYQVKTCFEKVRNYSYPHLLYNFSRQLKLVMNMFIGNVLNKLFIFIFFLGIFQVHFFLYRSFYLIIYLECLEYIRIGYNRVATYQSIYDFGQLCLVLLEKNQPSMKSLIEKMFKNEIEYIVYDENFKKKIEELEENIRKFKEKLFKKKNLVDERTRCTDEHVSIEM